jgi:hypothetical protein
MTTNLLDKNLAIPRAKMPQLAGMPAPESKASQLPRDPNFGGVDLAPLFIEALKRCGAEVRVRRVHISLLHATQDELNMEKVHALAKRILEGSLKIEPLFVSRDFHVIDGHHRWAACAVAGIEYLDVEHVVNMKTHDILRLALHVERTWGPLQ